MRRDVTTKDSSAAFADLRARGLAEHVAELEADGLTVVPPDVAGTADLTDRLLVRITEIATERAGVAPDFETGATHSEITSPDGQLLKCLMTEGEIFEDAMLHPVVLGFARYLIGADVTLFTARSIIKGPGKLPLFLHADQPIGPTPTALLCNVTYTLTDYTRANGCLCFVPGSHKYMRQPAASEDFSFGDGLSFIDAYGRVAAGSDVEIGDPPNVLPVEAPKGSLIVWHGNTWHGAFARTAPGLRASFILVFANKHLRPQEPYPDAIPAAAFERHDRAFARLVGRELALG